MSSHLKKVISPLETMDTIEARVLFRQLCDDPTLEHGFVKGQDMAEVALLAMLKGDVENFRSPVFELDDRDGYMSGFLAGMEAESLDDLPNSNLVRETGHSVNITEITSTGQLELEELALIDPYRLPAVRVNFVREDLA